MMSSPTSPSRDRMPLGVDHGERPAVERQADPHRARRRRGAPRRRRRSPRSGRRCSTPRAPATTRRAASSGGHASPPKISSRTFSIASGGHSAASVGTVETTVMPCVDQPRTEVLAAAHERAGRGHEAGAVPPGEPHLLARRVEGDREAGQHAVAGPERRRPAGTAAPRRRRRRPPSDASPRRPSAFPVDPEVKMIHASSSRPGGVGTAGSRACWGAAASRRTAPSGEASGSTAPLVGSNAPRPLITPRTAGLAEHQPGALLGVVGVDRHVRGTRGHRSRGSRCRARASPTASGCRRDRRGARPPRAGERRCAPRGPCSSAVAEGAVGVLERRRVGMRQRGRAEDVDEGPGRRRECRTVEDAGDVSGHVTSCSERSSGAARARRRRPPDALKLQPRRETTSCAFVNRE